MNKTLSISLNNIQFTWPKAEKPVLNIPHWQVEAGQRVFLYGRSGSGKSTLLNIVAGILQPQTGIVNIAEQNIFSFTQRKRDKFRARHLGVIFQQFNLIPYLSVKDNICLSQSFSGVPFSEERIEQLTRQLGLNKFTLSQAANQLSVGQQQRVAVARALYHRPDIIIADEPTSALDAETRDEFIQLLLAQSQQTNSTVLFVSHDKSLATHFDQLIDLSALNQLEKRHVI
jgi:putative ABC transport system ATP-binding protein